MSKGSMREQMPQIAALIDDLREAFGKEYIDSIIRAGVNGQPVFHATENGHEVGTKFPQGIRVGTNERGNRYLIDGPIKGDVVESTIKSEQWTAKK